MLALNDRFKAFFVSLEAFFLTDLEYMSRALSLAERGCGRVSPNPMVGAVIVKDGRIIGEGWHEQFGGPHAERRALANCTEDPRGATIYVTLEPCCHWGKTPPCTDAILEAGLSRVVIGSSDPNPLVAGKGAAILREHGVQVEEGVLREACDALNVVFFHFISTHQPYGVLKYAMTLDGKLATSTGLSRWITGEAARARVHADRNRYAAILVGVGTVLADDPLLTCRAPGGRDPVRIICDTRLRTPLTAQVVTTAKQTRTILATCCADLTRQQPYRDAGCELLVLPERNGHVDLTALMTALGAQNLDSVLIEGGADIHWSALEQGVVHRVQAYIAPKLFGGLTAKSPVGGPGVPAPDACFRLSAPTITRLGDDLLLESEVL